MGLSAVDWVVGGQYSNLKVVASSTLERSASLRRLKAPHYGGFQVGLKLLGWGSLCSLPATRASALAFGRQAACYVSFAAAELTSFRYRAGTSPGRARRRSAGPIAKGLYACLARSCLASGCNCKRNKGWDSKRSQRTPAPSWLLFCIAALLSDLSNLIAAKLDFPPWNCLAHQF